MSIHPLVILHKRHQTAKFFNFFGSNPQVEPNRIQYDTMHVTHFHMEIIATLEIIHTTESLILGMHANYMYY